MICAAYTNAQSILIQMHFFLDYLRIYSPRKKFSSSNLIPDSRMYELRQCLTCLFMCFR